MKEGARRHPGAPVDQDAGDLMRAVEAARAARGFSKAEVARRSGLPPETVRRLLSTPAVNPTLETVLGMLRTMGLGLAVTEVSGAAERARPDPELVKAWLAHLGAPLFGTSAVTRESVPQPEFVLAEALALARTDAAVARSLPTALWRVRPRLKVAELRRLASERGQAGTLGFFLELTADLSGDRSLARAARPLRPRRQPRRAAQFFRVRSRLERRLAEEKTPAVARRWNFRMNMSLDSFASMFRKAQGEERS